MSERDHRRKAKARINRMIGQLNAVKDMMEKKCPCHEIFRLLMAVNGALLSLMKHTFRDWINSEWGRNISDRIRPSEMQPKIMAMFYHLMQHFHKLPFREILRMLEQIMKHLK